MQYLNPNNWDEEATPRTDSERAKWRGERLRQTIEQAQQPVRDSFKGFKPTQTTTHKTLGEWLGVLADWYDNGIDARVADNPQTRMLGFAGIEHPECHEVSLTATKGEVPKDVAERLGYTPLKIYELLSTHRGRAQLIGSLEYVLDPDGVTESYTEQDFLDLCVTLKAYAQTDAPVDAGELIFTRPTPREDD